ncbi:carboxypeptidase-like regulatory domain-containing protein [Dokdonia ponticola]|uniref:Carboxypeptidase-like regulatory domain-containing protein n=2 Tax=Dokdonia ponticola TaxID=2041041 RepID=A0ABV9HZE8_9FLAO
MRALFFLFFLGFPSVVWSQTMTGTVYDDKEVVEGVLVKNLTTKMATLTNDEGRFEIDASPQDSISFYVFTHESQTMVLNEDVNYTDIVVELTRKVNQLDEVVVQKEVMPVFRKQEFADTFENQMQKNVELYPELYEFDSNPNGNINFVNIGKRLWKLIKKDRPKPPPFVAITLEQYIVLFKEDAIINNTFLTETVKIPLEFKPLFIDFCISKNIDSQLLKEKNRFLLIEEFINRGKEFLELLASEKE